MNVFANRPDVIGMAASGLCALHCAVTPLFFVTQPFVHEAIANAGDHGHGHGIWSSLDVIFLALSLIAVVYAAKVSQSATIKLWLWAGWALFAGGLLMEHFELPGWLMYLGSAILVVTHLTNLRRRQTN